MGTPLRGPWRSLRGRCTGDPRTRCSSPGGGLLGRFRGDADRPDEAQRGCVEAALAAPPRHAKRGRCGARRGDRPCGAAGACAVTSAANTSGSNTPRANISRTDAGPEWRSVAALSRGRSRQPAAFSAAGRPVRGGGRPDATARQVHRAEPHRRDPDLRQCDRVRRGQHRFQFQERAAEAASEDTAERCGDDIRSGAELPAGAASQTAEAEKAATAGNLSQDVGAPGRSDGAGAPRRGSAEQSAARNPSAVGGQSRRRRTGGSAGGIFRLLHRTYGSADAAAAQHVYARDAAATAAAVRRQRSLCRARSSRRLVPPAALGRSVDRLHHQRRTPTGAAGSGFMVAAPELQVASDWERHSLTADIVGSWTQYFTEMVPSLNVPYVNSKDRRPRRRDPRHPDPA